MNPRSMSFLDSIIHEVDHGLQSLTQGLSTTNRAYPAQGNDEVKLSKTQYKHVAGLMRVNHAGEIAAQGLYQGQAFTARSDAIKQAMQQSAIEESDHLDWCQKRLTELGERPSFFDPLWYSGAWCMGALAGAINDPISLGFVVETEKQVEAHLHDHIDQLPKHDTRSQAILEQMAIDEAHHAEVAHHAGAKELPWPVKKLMHGIANIMKITAYRI